MMSKRSLRFLLAMGVFLMIPNLALATVTGTIKGKVQNEDGEPLIEAPVRFTSNSLISEVIALTDENGEFVRAGLPPGNYEVTVTYIGFADLTKTAIRLGIGDEITLNFVMKVEVIEGGETQVVDQAPVDREKTATTDKITQEDIEDIADTDPARQYQNVIDRLPGVRDGQRHVRCQRVKVMMILSIR